MQLGKEDYKRLISRIDSEIKTVFGSEMIKTEETDHFEGWGFFRLKYQYIPKNYRIEIESEKQSLIIKFFDSEEAFNSVTNIRELRGWLSEDLIIESIKALKEILDGNEYNLYLIRDGKLYRKTPDNKIKRLKNMWEMLNG